MGSTAISSLAPPDMVVTSDARDILGLRSTQAVHSMVQKGVLRATRLPNGYLVFSRAEVEALAAERQAERERRARG